MDYLPYAYCSEKIYQSYIALAEQFFKSKSIAWIEEWVPRISYPKSVFDHIVATSSCIHLTQDIAIYDVSGSWRMITNFI